MGWGLPISLIFCPTKSKCVCHLQSNEQLVLQLSDVHWSDDSLSSLSLHWTVNMALLCIRIVFLKIPYLRCLAELKQSYNILPEIKVSLRIFLFIIRTYFNQSFSSASHVCLHSFFISDSHHDQRFTHPSLLFIYQMSLFLWVCGTELQLSCPAGRSHLLLSWLLWSPWQPACALLQTLPCQPPQQWGGGISRDSFVPDVSPAHQHKRVWSRGAGVHCGGCDQVLRPLLASNLTALSRINSSIINSRVIDYKL